MKNIIKKLAAGTVALTLAACSSASTAAASTAAASASAAPEKLTVIATANPHAVILEEAKPILLEKYNIDLEITVTDDYYTPNEAVSNGDADANYFQHVPFFDNEKATNGYKISNVGGVHIEPFGFYSKTIKNIDDLPDNATIVISNSVADNGRILSILQKAGLITIKDGVETINATLSDIQDNPKNLQFKEVKPELLATAYENGEGDLVAINGNYAIQAGLKPSTDAVLLESATQDNPYVNIVVCQEGHENDYKIKSLVEVLQSDEIKNFITTNWSDGSVIPAE
jgi:D-methionine transport system substrate-binding protein